jgi:hypothetical protein
MLISGPAPVIASPSDAFDWDRFVAVADRIAPDFDAMMGARDLVDSSILFSDGLCLCALAELFTVDALAEAGTGYGGSTEMLARYFIDRPVDIWSIDIATTSFDEWLFRLRIRARPRHLWPARRRAGEVAAERLRCYPRVTLAQGDAMVELPRLISAWSASRARIGVLLDGPKEEPQLRLAEQLLAMSPRVAFVALDDIGPKYDAEGRLERFRRSPYAAFTTADPAFVQRYRWIDRERLPDYMRVVPNHPGYGMGILVNR